VIGLSTAAISQLALILALQRMTAVLQRMALTATPKDRPAFEHLVAIRTNLINANSFVYLAVLVWWIGCLWIDEPGTESEPAAVSTEE
jgi:hypothetical protein